MRDRPFAAFAEFPKKEVLNAIADFWDRREVYLKREKEKYIKARTKDIVSRRIKRMNSWWGKLFPKKWDISPEEAAVLEFGEGTDYVIGSDGWREYTSWYNLRNMVGDVQDNVIELETVFKTAKTAIISSELWDDLKNLFKDD